MKRNHPLQCAAAGNDFNAYTKFRDDPEYGKEKADADGRWSCPVCSKPVKLIVRQTPRRHIIPAHLMPMIPASAAERTYRSTQS